MLFTTQIAVLAAALALQATPAPREISLASDPGPLAGTLLDAGPGAPAALIIAGSGPTDRDGNSPLGITASTYRLLAEGLAAEGITTLRYDKRGIAGSAAAAVPEADLRFDSFVADARAFAARLRAETGQPCVWLIGHSEGALIAQSVAVDDEGVCGLILVSGAGRPAAVVLREQFRAGAPEPMLSQALAIVDELEAGRTVECPPLLASICRASVQPYLISWFGVDPAALAASEELPTLIVQGSTDIQTTLADAEALHGADPQSELVVLEGVNHVLKVASLDRMANVATYADPGLPLADGVVGAISAFILRPSPR